MDRRELFGILGAGAVGLSVLAQTESRAEEDTAHHHEHGNEHEECMKACGECAKVCNETASHCLKALNEGTGDRKMHAKVHALTMDCQEFCVLSATLIARDSELMGQACEACAEACRVCAAACEAHPASEQVQACVKACRHCESTCRAMSKSMRGHNT